MVTLYSRTVICEERIHMHFIIKNKKITLLLAAILLISLFAIRIFILDAKDKAGMAYELHTLSNDEKNVLGVLVFNNEIIQKEKIGSKYYFIIKNSTLNDHSSKDQTPVKLECTEKQFNFANDLKEGTSFWISLREKHRSKAGWQIVDLSFSRPNLSY